MNGFRLHVLICVESIASETSWILENQNERDSNIENKMSKAAQLFIQLEKMTFLVLWLYMSSNSAIRLAHRIENWKRVQISPSTKSQHIFSGRKTTEALSNFAFANNT